MFDPLLCLLAADPVSSKLMNGQAGPDKVLRFMPFSDGT